MASIERTCGWWVVWPPWCVECLATLVGFRGARDSPVLHPHNQVARGLLAQDSMVNETQGAIVDRTKEHLAATDLLLIMTRKMLQQAVNDVGEGRDPKFSNPEPDDEGMVRVNGDDEFELR